MQTPHKLTTPFGSLEVHLYYREKENRYDLVAFGTVTINRVEYSAKQEATTDENNTWKEKRLDLDRKDRKDVPAYPYKAREKFTENVLANLPHFITDEIKANAVYERRQQIVNDLEEKVQQLVEELTTVKTDLINAKMERDVAGYGLLSRQ